jgi:hypothetical protein
VSHSKVKRRIEIDIRRQPTAGVEGGCDKRSRVMTKFALAVIAALTLGMSVASAAPRIGDGINLGPATSALTYGVGSG